MATVSASILNALPRGPTQAIWNELRNAVSIDPRRLIVLDDDPTGCQTVYDCNVLLDYSVERIEEQLRKDEKLFYILPNTRSMPEDQAVAVTKEVVENVQIAVDRSLYRQHIQYISRSDSTLRGHHPAEVQAVADSVPVVFEGTILVPCFFEGGRITFNDVHYVCEGDMLTPAGETPFAKDSHFGFTSSDLKDWVVEKSKGTVTKDSIISISLKDIREGGPNAVAEKLLSSAVVGRTVIVNAVHHHDLNTFMLGLLQAEADGAHFIYRTAASFVASRAGLEPRNLLTAAQLRADPAPSPLPSSLSSSSSSSSTAPGGLIVVGSYVPKTSKQLAALLAGGDVVPVEVSVKDVVAAARSGAPAAVEAVTAPVVDRINGLLAAGQHAVLFTTRGFLAGTTLADGQAVSDAVVDIVRRVAVQPSFLVAKGGITSHDVALKGLGIQIARVVGQVEPGVPVWRAGQGSRFPDMHYVVFPGNVGDDDALLRVAMTLGVNQSVAAAPATRLTHADCRVLTELVAAQREGRALAAFNVYNLEGAKAAVAAAEKLQSPVMLQVHPKQPLV